MTTSRLALAVAVASVLSSACTMADMASSPGMGATPGGVKDMGTARELIAQGQVPPSEAFLVEGMFSEHDLPLDGPSCQRTLCLRAALGWAPTVGLEEGLKKTIRYFKEIFSAR